MPIKLLANPLRLRYNAATNGGAIPRPPAPDEPMKNTENNTWTESPGHIAWIEYGGVRTEVYAYEDGSKNPDCFIAPYFNAIDCRNGYRHGSYFHRKEQTLRIIEQFDRVSR
jgi:hypothetical protein